MIVEQIKRIPGLQIVLSAFILLILFLKLPVLATEEMHQITPFIAKNPPLFEEEWFKLLLYSINFLLIFFSLFQLSSLLRNYHFSGDSRFEQLFLLVPFLLLFPSILSSFPLALGIFLLLRSFRLLFRVHTQININSELSWMAFNMSLVSMLDPLAVGLAFLLYIGTVVQRGFYLRELVLSLVVFALPYYLLLSLLYLFDLPIQYNVDLEFDVFVPENGIISYLRLAFGLLFLYFLLRSFGINAKEVLRAKAQFRNFYHFLFLALLGFFIHDPQKGAALLLLPIFAVFSQTFPHLKKKWVYESILLLISLGAIAAHFIAK